MIKTLRDLMNDNDREAVDRMLNEMGNMVDNLPWKYGISKEDRIMKHIKSALLELELGVNLFVAQSVKEEKDT